MTACAPPGAGSGSSLSEAQSRAPTLSFSSGNLYDFGTRPTGTSQTVRLVINYSGTQPATEVSASAFTGSFTYSGGTYPGTGGTCGATISNSCSIAVTFTPSAPGPSLTAQLALTYTSGTQTLSARTQLSGFGGIAANLIVSDGPTFDYGSLATGTSTDKTFTVAYTGTIAAQSVTPAALAAPFTFKGGSYPGTGGTCGSSISANCTIVVTYEPTVVGVSSGSISLTYDDGAASRNSARAITGTAAASAVLSISDGATYSFGAQTVGSTANDKILNVTYSGGIAATAVNGSGMGAPYTFKGGSYPGIGGTCGTTISANCTIVVNFSPITSGTFNASAALNYFDGAMTQTALRPVTGTAVGPAALSISDGPTYAFGTRANGSSIDKIFTVTNSGGGVATSVVSSGLSAPLTFKGGTYPGTGGTCGSTVSPGTCSVVVTFAPTITGSSSQTLTLSYSDGVAAQTSARAISGAGATPATLSISDGPTYDFGTKATGSSTDKTLTVTYGGGVPASSVGATGLSAPFSFKGGSYPGSGGTCGTTIIATCTVVVTYNPSSAGMINAILNLAFDNGVSAQTATRTVQGTGSAPAVLTISDSPVYDYATHAVGSGTDKTLTVSYAGSLPAATVSATGLAAPFTFKGGSYPGTGGTCTATITTNCLLVVTYSPTAAVTSNATLILSYNDGLAPQTVNEGLSGTGASPALLTISDAATYAFGTHAIASSTDKTFTVSYSGGVSASGAAGTALTAPYSFKGGSYPGTGGTCGASITANCSVVVTYSPTAAILTNATLTLTYDNGVISSQTATRPMSGTGATVATLSISDGPTYDYGTKATGSATDKTFTVTYGGSSSATGVAVTGLSPPYAFKGGSFPGTGGTCGVSISSTCTLVITYSPTLGGLTTATLSLNYDNGAGAQSATRGIQGTGSAPALLTISDGPSYNYGTRAVSSSTDKTYTVSYTGTLSATSVVPSGLAAPYTFKGGSFPGTGGNCSATISTNCTIVITYAPTAAILSNGNLILSYNDGVTTQTANESMSGTGAPAATLTLSDGPTFGFGTHSMASSTDKIFTVTYAGGVPATSVAGATLSTPYTFKGGFFPGAGGTCGAIVSANCTVVVTYSPTSPGLTSSTLTLNYNTGATATSVSDGLTGTGSNTAVLTISDGVTYSYGTMATGTSTDKTFTITYLGGVPATSVIGSGLVTPYSYKGGSYPGTGGTCGSTISATCTVVVNYSPTTVGAQTDTITLNYNDGTSAQTAVRDVSATGATPATLVISDATTFNYGSVALTSTLDKTFTVTYGGGVPATGTAAAAGLAVPYTYKGGSFPGTGGTCAASISANCTIVVTYAPTVAITSNSTITLSYNDGAAAQTATRPVTGTGVTAAVLTISDAATYNYGTQATGSTTDKTFTITKTGGVDATAVSGSGLSTPYFFKGGSYPGAGGTCGTTINVTCTVVVSNIPTVTGVASQTLTLNYTNGVTTTSSTRPITGTAASPATLVISDAATYDYGNRVVAAATDKTFTVTYAGGVSATSVAASAISAPFTYKGGTYPGAGGTCTATISANCTIIMTFTPAAVASYSTTLILTYQNGVGAQTAQRPVTGAGITVASLAISDGLTYDYGTVALSYKGGKTFTVTNSGNATATGLAEVGIVSPYAFAGGSFPGTGGTCSTSLAGSSATCTLVINFSPVTGASYNSTIRLNYNDGSAAQQATRAITGLGSAISQIVAGDSHTCALYQSGQVKCWGSDASGQLGNDAAFANSATPVWVSGITTAVQIAAGANHTCARLAAGTVQCWGTNTNGQIGNNTKPTPQPVPVTVTGLSSVLSIAAGGSHTCAAISGAVPKCWGSDANGQLSILATSSDQALPAATSGASNSLSIITGRNHTCSRTTASNAECWGSNSSAQVGNSSGTDRNTAINVITGSVSQLSAGDSHTCSLMASGTLKCWGDNTYGQLGDGTNTISISPKNISGVSSVSSISLGNNHSCMLLNSGDAQCWGNDSNGQLGNNSTILNESAPSTVNLPAGSVSLISAGGDHSCALLNTNAVMCWGKNASGELGTNGSTSNQPVPVSTVGL
ncbi:MAG: choice-of-anchor D domain-containing protein [Methylotenera sp.]|nr:choice-of-anchor D domain-containing protein [Oligoflexia bacterium]